MAIEKKLYNQRETKNTVRYESKAESEDERPIVFYARKIDLPRPFPNEVTLTISW